MEAYASYESRVTFIFAEGPRPADPPSSAKELVVRSLRMVRMADGSGRVTGSFKNGLAVTVGEVAATLQEGSACLTGLESGCALCDCGRLLKRGGATQQ